MQSSIASDPSGLDFPPAHFEQAVPPAPYYPTGHFLQLALAVVPKSLVYPESQFLQSASSDLPLASL